MSCKETIRVSKETKNYLEKRKKELEQIGLETSFDDILQEDIPQLKENKGKNLDELLEDVFGI